MPFCDGSHEGTDITPLEFEVKISSTKVFCSCGLTKRPPDGEITPTPTSQLQARSHTRA